MRAADRTLDLIEDAVRLAADDQAHLLELLERKDRIIERLVGEIDELRGSLSSEDPTASDTAQGRRARRRVRSVVDPETDLSDLQLAFSAMCSALLSSATDARANRHTLHVVAHTFQFTERLVQLTSGGSFDLVQAHDNFALTAAHRIAVRDGAPLVADLVEVTSLAGRAGELLTTLPAHTRGYIELSDDIVIRRAAAVFTVSESLRAFLVDRHGGQVHLLRNARPYRPAVHDAGLRRLCDVAPETRIVCYANRIGLDMGILEVVGALAQMQTPAILVCVGRFTNAETERAVRECIAGLGQADSVRFVDNQPPEAFARLLSGADVGVNAIKPLSLNLRVSLPNRIFDYVAARVPIVTSDVGDSAQVVREHAIGEVLEAVEPGAIARALDQVLAQPEAYATRLEDAARALSWDREAQEYARTALKLAGRTRGPRRAAIVARKQIGYNNRILQQARTLHDLGFEVTVASTSGFDPAVAAELPAGVQELVIPWSATTRAPSQKPAAAAERRVRELLAEERRLEEAIADGAADADVQPQATQRLIRRLRRIEAISRGLTRTHARLRALGADVED